MKKINENIIRRNIIKLFWLIFSISMFLILGAAITKPLNNLVPQRMVLFTMVWIGFYGGLWLLFCFLERKFPGLEKRIKCCLPIYFVLFGAALFVVCCFLRSMPVTDYADVYNAAWNLAMGEEVTNWSYFARWTNNVGCMLFLSFLFSLGKCLPGDIDLYYFVLLVNVLLVVLFVLCLYYLANTFIKGHPAAVSLMVLAVCGTWIPFFANTSIFYSDQLSLGAGVFGVTLLVKGCRKHRWQIYFLAAGICFGVGITLKVTVSTVVIALAIAALLFPKLWEMKSRLLFAVIGCAVVGGAFSCYSRTLPYQEQVESLKPPVEYWFAIGLVGSGTYAESEDFAVRCLTEGNPGMRTEIVREQIRAEIHNLWDLDHIIAKTRQNFGCGDLGAAGYFLYPVEENFLWHCFSQEGTHFWRYACLTTSFFFSVLFYLGVGGLLQFFKKTDYDMAFFVAALTFWGLCLFMMLWEAQDKFLYNHSGWMILGLLFSLNLIGERMGKKK